MPDRLAELEGRVAELGAALARTEARVAALEHQGARRRPRPAAAQPPAGAKANADLASATRAVALVGRTLLVLAGAFLLRALTDAGTLPAWLGVAVGFVYAGVWIAMADRAGAGAAASAAFHGAAAVLIGFPLLVEAVTRFHLVSLEVAVAALGALTAVALAVAARRKLEVLAWLVELGGIGAAVALAVTAGRLAPSVVLLALLGVATLWLGYVVDWRGLRWPVAIAADLLVVVLAAQAAGSRPAESVAAVLFAQLLLVVLYLGSVAVRTLALHRNVLPFEIFQTAALAVVGLGGASLVANRTASGQGILGVVCIAIGVAAYGVAFAFVERRLDLRANFIFYTSVALVFVLAGTALALPRATLPVAWATLAVATAALGRTARRRTLAAHAAGYAVAAALAGGLLPGAVWAVFGDAAAGSTPVRIASVAVCLGMFATAWLTAGATVGRAPGERVPRAALLAVTACAAAGVVIDWIAPLVAGSPGASASAGVLATVRTAVLTGGAILLAGMARSERWREAGWLVYPLLGLVGLKMLVQDISRSRPATLFLAFGLYGAALLVVPRLRRRAAAGAAPPTPNHAP